MKLLLAEKHDGRLDAFLDCQETKFSVLGVLGMKFYCFWYFIML